MSNDTEQGTTKLQGVIESVFVPVMAILATPVRAMHMTIGHSWVSSATLIAVAIFGGMWIQAYTFSARDREQLAALALQREEIARNYALRSQKLEREEIAAGEMALSQLSWKMCALSIDANGVTLTFPKIGENLLVKWKPLRADRGGLLSYPIPDPEAGSMTSSVLVPAAAFGEDWLPGARISFDLEQVLANGRGVQYSQPGSRILLVP